MGVAIASSFPPHYSNEIIQKAGWCPPAFGSHRPSTEGRGEVRAVAGSSGVPRSRLRDWKIALDFHCKDMVLSVQACRPDAAASVAKVLVPQPAQGLSVNLSLYGIP